ncbi:hypothetical protein GGI43DRAFT_357225 [Trichoderma evansii]
MTTPEREWREICHSQFGPDAFINQGNFHVHLPLPPAPAKAVRVIPYLLNEDLVCRKDIIDQLDKLLPPLPGFYNAALWGLGGSGKTQIALDYAYRRCVDDECCVFWVHADSEATFTSDYKVIGKRLGIDEKNIDGLELLDAVRCGIEARPRWVLILDNADDLRLFGVGRTGESLAKYIPGGSQGTILWTSRDGRITGALVGSSRAIEVPSMTKDEATSLLELSMSEDLKPSIDTEMNRLLEELQRLPLAISQAGVYMRRTRTPIKEYLNLLLQGTSRWDLLKMTDSDRHRPSGVSNSVLETWRISIERIQEESELSYRILHVIAYLDSQDIPHGLILAASQGSASSGGDENTHKQNTNFDVLQAVTRLVEYSFLSMRRVEEGRRSYEMHKLVQEAVQYRLSVQGPDSLPLGEPTRFGETLKNTEVFFSSIALQIVKSAFENVPRPLHYQYIPHAIQASEWAEKSGKEVEASALLCTVSGNMKALGRWREKEPVDRKIISLRTKALGKEHTDTIKGMASLAVTLIALARYREAEKLTEQVLKLRQQSEAFYDKHPKKTTLMGNLAVIYRYQGRYNEAESLTGQVLSLQQEVLGEYHPDTLDSKENLAIIYQIQGRHKEASVLIEQTLDVRRELFGERHPATIRSILMLASMLRNQSRYDDSEQLAKRVLTFNQELVGENHPATIFIMAELAEISGLQGRYAESEKLAEQVLSLQLRDIGDKHPDTMKTMDCLAATYNNQGRRNDFQRLMEKVLRHRLESYGEMHPYTIRTMRKLAIIYRNSGQCTLSEKLENQVLKHQLEIFGEKHPETIRAMMCLAATYHVQGRHTEAERLKEQTLRLTQDVLHEKHPDIALAMSSLAETYEMQGRYDEAEKLKEQAFTLQFKVLGEKHPITIGAMAALSTTYYHQRRFAEAEKLEEQTLKLRQEILGMKHPETITTMTFLGAIYMSQGRWLDAQSILTKARILHVETFGEKHPTTLLIMERLVQCLRHTDPGEAKKMLVEMLQICREVNGDEHPNTIRAMENLAACEKEIQNKDFGQAMHHHHYQQEQDS